MSAELATLQKIKQHRDMYAIPISEFDPETQVDITGMFPTAFRGVADSVSTHDIFGDGEAIATYTLNGTLDDLGGIVHGSPSTDIETYVDSPMGQAVEFDGTYYIYTAKALNQLVHNFTISMWVNPTGLDGNRQGIFGNLLNEAEGVGLVWNGVKWSFSIGSGSAGTFDMIDNIPIPEDTWTHVTVSYDDETMRAYINGTMVGSHRTIGTKNAGATLLAFGNASGSDMFTGQLDHIRVFGRALVPAEVRTVASEVLPYRVVMDIREENVYASILLSADPFSDGSGTALFNLEDNVQDTTNTYNGSQTSVTYNPEGKFNYSAIFDITDHSRVQCASVGLDESFTYSFWVRHTGQDDEATLVCDLNESSTSQLFGGVRFFLTPDNEVTFRINNSTLDSCNIVSEPIEEDWVHVVGVYNHTAKKATLYLDGLVVGVDTSEPAAYLSASKLMFGCYWTSRYGTYRKFYNGELDQVRIFDKALTPQEVRKLKSEKVVV